MYTKFSTSSTFNCFCTLLWTNEYEFQFHPQDDVEHTCAEMQWMMGANVCSLVPIKSHHSLGNQLRSFTEGVLKKNPQLSTKSFKVGA
jgi:hypothetical protein